MAAAIMMAYSALLSGERYGVDSPLPESSVPP
jgi:hypothetical protein